MAIVFVQKVSAQTTATAASLTTGSITTTTGNAIIVQGSQSITATAPTSFTDNKSNTYTIDKNLGDTTNGNFATNASIGSSLSITGGSGHTFTINKTGGGVGMAIGAAEYTHDGVMATSLSASANGGTGGSTTMNPGAVTPTGGGGTNYLYVSAATSDNVSGATMTANTGAGWAMLANIPSITNSSKPMLGSSYVIGTGAKTGTITASVTTHWVAVVMTYSETASGVILTPGLQIPWSIPWTR